MNASAEKTSPFTTLKVLEREPSIVNQPEPLAAAVAQDDGCGNRQMLNYPANDAGRAHQFIDRHLNSVRYVPAWKKWLVWDEHYWRSDGDGAIQRLAIEHSKHLIEEAAKLSDHKQREVSVRAALALGNVDRIQDMLDLAKVDSRTVVRHDQLDQNPYLLGVRGGIFDLQSRTFRAGERSDLITKRAGVEYQANATCPRWLKFVEDVTCGDVELARYLQKFLGYTLTGSVCEQCFAFLFGGGDNGKSVFVAILQALFGDYGMTVPLSLIALAQNGREPSQELASLEGARFVVGPELEQGMRLAESRLKDLTGGNIISARRLYQESFNFQPVAKLWLFGNHKPTIMGTDLGIWRRVRLIPFEARIPDHHKDPALTTKLLRELSGILVWALDGLKTWQLDGLQSPKRVTDAVAEYRTEEDILGEFLAAEVHESPNSRVPFSDMFCRYRLWAGRGGIRCPLSSRGLAKALRERGVVAIRSNGMSLWSGVHLTAQ